MAKKKQKKNPSGLGIFLGVAALLGGGYYAWWAYDKYKEPKKKKKATEGSTDEGSTEGSTDEGSTTAQYTVDEVHAHIMEIMERELTAAGITDAQRTQFGNELRSKLSGLDPKLFQKGAGCIMQASTTAGMDKCATDAGWQ